MLKILCSYILYDATRGLSAIVKVLIGNDNRHNLQLES